MAGSVVSRDPVHDISERELAGAALQQSEERFRKIIELAPLAMAVVGTDGAVELINRRAISVFGYLPEDIPTMDRWWVHAYPDAAYRAEVIADWTGRVRKAIVEGQEIAGNEYRVTCKDGSRKTIFISGVPVAGKVFVMFDDITGRRQAEDNLRRSEQRYRRLVETTDTGYVIVDAGGRVLDANAEYVRLTGHAQLADILGRSVLDWTADEEKAVNAQAVASCMANGFIRNLEISYVDRAGKRTPVEINATVLETEGEQQVLSLCRDISERKRAQNLLVIQHTLAHELNTTSDIETWLGSCLDAALAVSAMDCGGIYLVSEVDESLTLAVHKGMSPEFVASVCRFDAQSPNAQLVLAGKPVYAEYSTLGMSVDKARRDERIRALAVIPVLYESRVIACFNLGSHSRDDVPAFARTALETIAAQIGTGIARLKTEAALRQSNEKLLKIFKTSPDAITITRLSDAKFLEVNPAFTDITGYTPEEAVGRSGLPGELSIWVSEDDRNRMVKALLAHGEIIGLEVPMRIKDGTIITALVSGRAVEIGGEQCVVLISRAISERKRMEEALRESEQHYKMISELATDYVFRLRVAADGRVAVGFVSDNFHQLTGRTKEESFAVEAWSKFIHPDDLGKVMEGLRRLATRPDTAEFECRSYVHGRTMRWVNIVVHSEWGEAEQRVVEIVGAVKDITQRKQAEQSTAAEKERLAVTLASIGDGVITTDIRGCIDLMNKVAEELTGWPQGEARGQPLDSVLNLLDGNTRKPCASPFARVLSSGQITELTEPTLLLTRAGAERVIADSGAPIKDGEGRTVGVVVVFRDMTEKQKLADAIQRAARLESLGVLAGGIAHDFNNLLTGIFGYVELARSVSQEQETLEYLGATTAAMNRARSLTLQLLTFAKGGAPVQRGTALAPFLQESVKFALSGSNVACKFALPDDLWACNIDKHQIAQVIDNVVINAQQAMPNGGNIRVAARNVAAAALDSPSLAAGDYVKISIGDEGIGIPRDVLPRIFDPFYTTKTKGHGLGLATSYSIVHRHGGCIEAESEPGRGSVFHIYLPVATGPLPSQELGIVERKGTGTIVVVDDEEVIRTALGKMLETLGYRAVCKRDGKEAIDFYLEETRSGRAPAAMIFDLTIPGGMGGVEAVAELRRLDRELPVFVVSGYADDLVMHNPAEHGFTASLCKPFTITELSTMLSVHVKA
jgi:PAS domain S-box-containing protein